MGESARNSKRIAETEILDSSITGFSKKMKFDFDFEEFSLPPLNFKLQARRCTSNESVKVAKDSLGFLDLEAKSSETESSVCIERKFRRETTTSSEFNGNTDHMDSPAAMEKKENPHRRKSPAVKLPSQAEIDEFFAEAEKEDQKRFAEKYNFDVVKDLPMEGRYQWTCLKPQRKVEN